MSRLDAIAALLNVNTDRARQFTRAIRENFEAAPSYAQIMEALRALPTDKPSVQQVVAQIKQTQAARDAARGVATPERPPAKPGPSAKAPPAKAPPAKRPPAKGRGKPRRPTSPHHKQRYGRKKPAE